MEVKTTRRTERVTQIARKIRRLDFIRMAEAQAFLILSGLLFLAIFLFRDGLRFNLTSINPSSWIILIMFKVVSAAFIFYLIARGFIKILAPKIMGSGLAWSIGILIALGYLISKFIY